MRARTAGAHARFGRLPAPGSALALAFRYGHCSFEVSELLVGFAVLVLKTTLQDLVALVERLPERGGPSGVPGAGARARARPTVIELSE